MDRFLTLTVFAKVVERGSFASAADDLDLSPASVSGHVKALEARLKTRLLNRTTRRVAPTDEGAAYYAHCKQILQHLDEADGMLAAQRESPRGTLRVLMPPLLGTLIVIPAMPAFLQRYPDMRVEITLAVHTPDLVGEGLDLAICVTPRPDPGVVFRPLGLVAIRTLASPDYLARRGVPATPDDLAGHDLIGVRVSPGHLFSTWRFQQDGKPITRDFECRLVADSGDAQRAAAKAGGGICQGAHYAVQDMIESGELVPVLDDWSWTGPPIGAMHLPNRFLSPKVQVFTDCVRGLLEGRVTPYRVDWDNR